jgi:5-methylcytosine-specific restriction endonuclease McrA
VANGANKNGTRRLSGWEWKAQRDAQLKRQPLCEACAADRVPRLAYEVDHIVRIVDGGKNEPSNYQSLCRDHHRIKTVLERGHKPRPAIGIDGVPIYIPTDWFARAGVDDGGEGGSKS